MFQIITSSGGTANGDGVLIPQSALSSYGLTTAEVTNDNTGFSRVVFAMLKALNATSFTGVLGMAKPAAPTESIISFGVSIVQFFLTVSKVMDWIAETVSYIPVPLTGTNAGIGAIDLVSIFPGASKVASGGSMSGAGILFLTSDLADYGAPAHADINLSSGQDNRDLIDAMFAYLSLDTDIPVRSTSTASALISRSSSAIVDGSLPTDAVATTNPTTALSATKVTQNAIQVRSKVYSFTLEIARSSTDTVDVRNVITA